MTPEGPILCCENGFVEVFAHTPISWGLEFYRIFCDTIIKLIKPKPEI